MTRAEEALFIAGSLGPMEKKRGPHADSWYARLRPLFAQDDGLEDDIWGARWEVGERPPRVAQNAASVPDANEPMPDWLIAPVGPEPRPPRPLAPSGLGDAIGADPPLPPGELQAAARRGVLMHALLERLPDLPAADRAAAAQTWLARQADDLTQNARTDMIDQALAVLADPQFADIFAPDALAEVPLAATVGGQVVSGTVDRLLVAPDGITVVDFKTARRPPATLDAIPVGTLQQMAAYVAALETIYPGRAVQAAVLYTQTPQLFALPPALMAKYKPGLSTQQERFAPPSVE